MYVRINKLDISYPMEGKTLAFVSLSVLMGNFRELFRGQKIVWISKVVSGGMRERNRRAKFAAQIIVTIITGSICVF